MENNMTKEQLLRLEILEINKSIAILRDIEHEKFSLLHKEQDYLQLDNFL